MTHPVVHFEIRSADPDATRAFYGDLFGWKFPEGGLPGYTAVDTGTAGALPGGISPLQGGEEMVTFYVGVEDVSATLAAAVAGGGRIVQPAFEVPGVSFGLFADPQGHVVGVASPTS
jgi:predicted enzyme related to lactoylglutathione lyase